MRNGSTVEGEAWQCVWHSCPWWGLLLQEIFAHYAPKNTVLFICLGYCDVLWMKANWWVFLIFFTLFAASPSHCVGFCAWKGFVYSIFHQYIDLSIFVVFSRLFSATPPLFMFWFVFIYPTAFAFGIISVSFPGRDSKWFKGDYEGVSVRTIPDGTAAFWRCRLWNLPILSIWSDFEYLQWTWNTSHGLGWQLKVIFMHIHVSVVSRGRRWARRQLSP